MLRRYIFLYWMTFLSRKFCLTGADSCCGESHCSQSCPWNDACSDGRDLDCKDSISGPFRCRDRSKCTTFDECMDAEAALRAGYTCNAFPFYNGGYPIDSLDWDNEVETYGCTHSSDNEEYCAGWFAKEDSLSEFELGDATCTLPSDNGEYCAKWTVAQTEYKKCWYSYVANDDGGTSYEITCCNSENKNFLPCCQTLCSTSFYDGYPVQREYADCVCTRESRRGHYCAAWYCEEYEYSPQSYAIGREFEYYTCLRDDASGSSSSINNIEEGLHCTYWNGAIDSREEFEVSSCSCTMSKEGGERFCSSWGCIENGLDYHWPNVLWCLFSGILGVFPLLLFLCVDFDCFTDDWTHIPSNSRYISMRIATLLVWTGSFCFIGIWKAGMVVFVLVFLPAVIATLLAISRRYYFAPAFTLENYQQVTSLKAAGYLEDEREVHEEARSAVVLDPVAEEIELGTSRHAYRLVRSARQNMPPSFAANLPSAVMVEATSVVATAEEEEEEEEERSENNLRPTAPPVDLTDRQQEELRRLKQLYESGLISFDFYSTRLEELL